MYCAHMQNIAKPGMFRAAADLRIWLMDDGRAGFRAQTIGLGAAVAQKLAAMADADTPQIISKTLSAASWTAKIFPTMAAAYVAPSVAENEIPPDMIIACGSAAVVPALAARRRYGAFVAYVQRPPVAAALFDTVVCGYHDRLSGDNVLPIIGSVGGIHATDLARRRAAARQKFAALSPPYIAVLVGGENRAFALTPSDCQNLAAQLRAVAGGLLITTSRRTGMANIAALTDAFNAADCHFFVGGEDNPYIDMLAAADYFVVTGDSVNMLSEACTTGKPVYIFPLRQKFGRTGAAAKFYDFHDFLIKHGHARRWCEKLEDWQPLALDETTRAADFIVRRYLADQRCG